MPTTVLLKDIVDALEIQFDESSSFLDLDTGQVETVSHDLLHLAEEPDDEEPDLPDWQKGAWEIAKRIVSSDRFVKLPTKFDIHEWSIMEEFALSVESETISNELVTALHGKGAFRYFKDTLRRHRIEKEWYAFRDDALREIAIEWCEENQIAWK
jgi:Uncharacterised protein family (UPF0158)